MPYTTATLIEKDPAGPDGTVSIRVQFSGAGEVDKVEGYTIDGNTTIQSLKDWARGKAVRLASKTIATSLTVGMSVSLTPPAAPTPTAQEAWNAKVGRYLAGKQLASTNSTAVSDLAALFNDINATYQSTFL